MEAVLASQNKKKLKELSEILGEIGITVKLQSEVGVSVDVEETGTTFEENAMLKAKAVCEATGMIAISDDSGLMVDALDGAPGVYSARYGGEDLDDKGRYELLLKNMEEKENRACKFVCVVCCAFPDGHSITARGECPGIIARDAQGDGGFGYDPVFYLPELERYMAQLSPEEKNKISHRGKALGVFKTELENYFNGLNK